MVLRACNPSVIIPIEFVSGIAGRGVRTKARFSTNTASSAISIANMPSNDWRSIRSDLRRRPGCKGLGRAKPGTLLNITSPYA